MGWAVQQVRARVHARRRVQHSAAQRSAAQRSAAQRSAAQGRAQCAGVRPARVRAPRTCTFRLLTRRRALVRCRSVLPTFRKLIEELDERPLTFITAVSETIDALEEFKGRRCVPARGGAAAVLVWDGATRLHRRRLPASSSDAVRLPTLTGTHTASPPSSSSATGGFWRRCAAPTRPRSARSSRPTAPSTRPTTTWTRTRSSWRGARRQRRRRRHSVNYSCIQ